MSYLHLNDLIIYMENIKQAKENECSQYKKYCCDFSLQSAHLAHPYFLKWHPGMFCTRNLT
jgi:hypothetical protein